jgi:hypothetical protein
MPKFRINCYSTISYTLLVEAPNEGIAAAYYDICDSGDFHRCSETGWELDEIVPADREADDDVDVVLGPNGEVDLKDEEY